MTKTPKDPNAIKALDQMKKEIAKELGIKDDFFHDKEDLTASVENIYAGGHIGGNMVKRMIEMSERQLMNKRK